MAQFGRFPSPKPANLAGLLERRSLVQRRQIVVFPKLGKTRGRSKSVDQRAEKFQFGTFDTA